jgi:hypothetical protein
MLREFFPVQTQSSSGFDHVCERLHADTLPDDTFAAGKTLLN